MFDWSYSRKYGSKLRMFPKPVSDYSYDLSKKLKIECVYCTRTVEFSNFPYTRKVNRQDQRLII